MHAVRWAGVWDRSTFALSQSSYMGAPDTVCRDRITIAGLVADRGVNGTKKCTRRHVQIVLFQNMDGNS